MTPAEVLKFAEKNGAKMVDFKFVDLLGIWQHTTMPIHKLEVDTFKDGYFFDGSSIRGSQPIHASDMIFIPDADSAFMDPFFSVPTLSLSTRDWPARLTCDPRGTDGRSWPTRTRRTSDSTWLTSSASGLCGRSPSSMARKSMAGP